MPHRRRKRKLNIGESASPMGGATSTTAAEPPLPVQKEMLGAVFERVLALVNERARFTDRIAPMAVFVYPNGNENTLDGDMKAVRVSWQGEVHKEIMKKRIRDKAAVEGAVAVVLLTEPGPSKAFLLSGATLRARAHASVAYTYDRKAKTFTFSPMEWLDQPQQNFFLDGILLKG